MKNSLFAIGLLKAMLLLSTATFAQNLVDNGDFEARNQAPQTTNNVGPVTTNHPHADLQYWYRTPTPSSTDPISNYPDYVATDGASAANPATYFPSRVNYTFAPHGGKGCVVLYQHDFNGDHRYNSIITRSLGTALTVGRAYQVEYWVRRLASNQYSTELALYITNQAPTFDSDYVFSSNTYSYNFAPSPGNKVLLSGDIRDTQNWTRVSAVITPTDAGNQWVTIGYASTGQHYDSSIPGYSVAGIYYAIDDVSITEVPCNTVTIAPDINLARQGSYSPPYSNFYDVRVNNVGGATSFTLDIESPDGYGGWVYAGTYQAYTYTGPDNPSSNEVQGFTTFHTGFIGPVSSGTPGGIDNNTPATYRLTVKALSPCNSVTTQKILTLPPYGGDYGESNRTAGNALAYPNPATSALALPEGTEQATLLNDNGKPIQKADASGKLDVQSLPDGLYNLQMMQDGKLINQRIQVKH